MSKHNSSIPNRAFNRNPTLVVPSAPLINETNNFNVTFDVKPLDQAEIEGIHKLLLENSEPGSISEEKISKDVIHLKEITEQLRGVVKQGTVLIGERVFRAKEVLKPYKDGTFTKWLTTVFGTRKTGYNKLNYYELYNSLPHVDLKDLFKKMPEKTAYILASREGDISIKEDIIREHYHLRHDDLIEIIDKRLPVSDDKRAKKDDCSQLVSVISRSLKKLKTYQDELTELHKDELLNLKELIESMVFANV